MRLSNFGKLSQFLIFEVLVSIQNWLMASLISPNLYWISRFRLSLPLLRDAKICYTKNHSKYVFIMKFCWLQHIYARTYIEICNGYKWNSSGVFLRLTKELWLYISKDGAEWQCSEKLKRARSMMAIWKWFCSRIFIFPLYAGLFHHPLLNWISSSPCGGLFSCHTRFDILRSSYFLKAGTGAFFCFFIINFQISFIIK